MGIQMAKLVLSLPASQVRVREKWGFTLKRCALASVENLNWGFETSVLNSWAMVIAVVADTLCLPHTLRSIPFTWSPPEPILYGRWTLTGSIKQIPKAPSIRRTEGDFTLFTRWCVWSRFPALFFVAIICTTSSPSDLPLKRSFHKIALFPYILDTSTNNAHHLHNCRWKQFRIKHKWCLYACIYIWKRKKCTHLYSKIRSSKTL